MSEMETLARLTVELKGHLIDSLTLAKVIDLIQNLGGSYHLNHLSIGSQKNQLSSVNLTITAESGEQFQQILEQLRPYGIQTVSTQDASLTALTQPQVLPAGAALPIHFPKQVFCNGEWIVVDNGDEDLALVVNPTTKTATVKAISNIQVGELVVVGSHGIEWQSNSAVSNPEALTR